MIKRSRKAMSLFVIAVMVFSLFAMAIPAFAATTNKALTVPNVTTGVNQSLGTIRIEETTPGVIGSTPQDILVTLPDGVEYANDPALFPLTNYVNIPVNVGGVVNTIAPADITLTSATDKVLNLRVNSPLTVGAGGEKAFIELVFDSALGSGVNITAAPGDVEIDIYESSGAVNSGKVVNARVVSAGTTATALTKPAVNRAAGQGFGTIRIIENSPGALAAGNEITFVLPDDFTWAGGAAINLAGGFVAGDVRVRGTDTDALGRSRYTFDIVNASTARAGVIDISGWRVDVDSDAPLGDVSVKIGGDATAATLDIAKAVDYGVDVSAKTVPEIFAGRWAADIDTIVLEETSAGSVLPGRTIKLTLPEGAVWSAAPNPIVTKGNIPVFTAAVPSNNNRTITYTAGGAVSGTASTVELRDGAIDLKANFPAGELSVEIEGNAGVAGDVTVATIVAPVTAEASETTNVGIGLMDQAIGDIIITEVADGAILANPQGARGEIVVRTPFAGMVWAGIPTITVEEGNIKLNVAGATGTGGRDLIIPVRASSTVASTIKISDAKVTLDRTVPYGAQSFGIRGGGIDWAGNAGAVALSDAAKVVAAMAATPAPGYVEVKESVFTIGESSYFADEEEVFMDVAPYIKGDRTFLPVRYVANALGVDNDNILWDQASKTVTVFKGDRIAQMTIGSDTMLVNGVTVNMDVAPEITDGRTMLPIRWMSQAVGATIDWDAEARTVTVTQ